MIIACVSVHVKTECVDAFLEATLTNARQSVQEPGIARFDVIQQTDDPTRFMLYEAYHNDEAPAAHKKTSHYLAWRDTVAAMMAEPRQATKYHETFWTS